VNYLSQSQQVKKNQSDIITINEDINGISVGPQGTVGPRGEQGIQGTTGPTGPDGTPASSLTFDSAFVGGGTQFDYKATITVAETGSANRRYTFSSITTLSSNDANNLINLEYSAGLYKKMSIVDEFWIDPSGSTFIIKYYDETGEITTVIGTGTLTDLNFYGKYDFTIQELVEGTEVGPTGPAGATGPQGDDGPQGSQGIQGLTGEQNISFLDTYEDGDTFTEYNQRVLIQCVGGDYDGYTAIKEEMVEDDTVKFGPYATLVSIENPSGTIISTLLNGVTSIRVYAIENLT